MLRCCWTIQHLKYVYSLVEEAFLVTVGGFPFHTTCTGVLDSVCGVGAIWSVLVELYDLQRGWYRPSQKFVLQLWWLVQFNRLFSPPTSYQDEGGNADFRKKWMNFNMALKPQFLNYIWNTGTIKSNKKAIIYPDIQSQIFIFPLFSRDIKMKCIASQTLLLLHSLRLRVKTRKFICVPLGTYLT